MRQPFNRLGLGGAALVGFLVLVNTTPGSAQESTPADDPGPIDGTLEAPIEYDPADYETTEPLPEAIERVDVHIGRVRVDVGDAGRSRDAKRWTERRLRRTGGSLIQACFEPRPSDALVDVESPEPPPPIPDSMMAGDLTLSGRCSLGICQLRPRLLGGLDRALGTCVANAVADSLTGFPDPERQYEVRIPLRFQVVVAEEAAPVEPPSEGEETPTGLEPPPDPASQSESAEP